MYGILEKINSFLGSTVTVFLLLSGITVTVAIINYTALHPVRFLKTLTPQKTKSDSRSPLGSLCLALAGTLGVGNISGVAAAISVGGAGSVFWMWMCSFFCAALKYAEAVLAVKYRIKDLNGEYEGGAHLYIQKAYRLPALGGFFCILCLLGSFTTGNVTQANAAAQSAELALGVDPMLCGVILTVLILIFCRSGSAIYSFTLRLIPLLCVGYVILCSCVMIKNSDQIGEVTQMILASAFTARAGVGGALGVICNRAVRFGITRGVMSNEAGCGTAPIAHASANTDSPAAQGFLGIIEVLFDTLVLCSLTAYVILLSGVSTDTESSTSTAINAFTSTLGNAVAVPLAISMLLFALASAAGWNYYGKISLTHLGASKKTLNFYTFFYAICAFFGALIPEGIIWQLSDLSIYTMAFINTCAVLLLIGEVREETKLFVKKDDPLSVGKNVIP
ncbi:MAG: amino acid carrier protein [Clostridia bacterium]|nr:amino acid carrier protein [Clostridia bacterium]